MNTVNKSKNEKIIKQFLLMSRKMPLNKINVGVLCREAGVSRSTFYRRYESIYDLAEELEEKNLNEFMSIAKRHELERSSLEDYMKEILGFIHREESFFKSVLSEYSDQHFVSRWKKIMLDDVAKEYQLAQSEQTGEVKLAMEMMISGVVGAYSHWLFHPKEVTFDMVLQLVLRIWDFYRI